jgi:signal transduction histidine kinase
MKLKRKNTKAQMRAPLESDFVTNASHELFTPLALIRLHAETLELGRVTSEEKRQQYYRTIRLQSEKLTEILGGILDGGRLMNHIEK